MFPPYGPYTYTGPSLAQILTYQQLNSLEQLYSDCPTAARLAYYGYFPTPEKLEEGIRLEREEILKSIAKVRN